MSEIDKVTEKFYNALKEAVAKSNWGIVRNIWFEMAECYAKAGENQDALQRYLEVLYLDINGPRNRGQTDPELLREFPPFNPDDGFIAPAVSYEIKRLMKELKISTKEVKDIFIRINEPTHKAVNLPISAEEAWNKQEADETCGISNSGN